MRTPLSDPELPVLRGWRGYVAVIILLALVAIALEFGPFV